MTPERTYFARVSQCRDGAYSYVAGTGGQNWRNVEMRDMGFAPNRIEAWRLARVSLSRLVNEQHATRS